MTLPILVPSNTKQIGYCFLSAQRAIEPATRNTFKLIMRTLCAQKEKYDEN